MRCLAALVALAAIGCTDKAIELTFEVAEADQDMDVSCVNTVQVVLHNGDPDFTTVPTQCVEVESPTSLADIQRQIRGKFSLPMPDKVIAIEVRGLASTTPDLCGTGINVFYAGNEFVGQDVVPLKARGTLGCDAMATTETRSIQTIDYFALASTAVGAEPVCEVPPGFIDVAEGTIRPTNIFLPDFPPALAELGVFAQLSTAGTATLPAWTGARGNSCLAISAFEIGSASCIYPNASTVCAPRGTAEVPIVRGAASFESIQPEIYADFPIIVYGAVWDTVSVPKKPIAGATITIPPDKGTIVYVDSIPGAQRVQPHGGAATNAGGLFIAYLKEPTLATITGGGTTKQRILGGSFAWGSAIIVPLP